MRMFFVALRDALITAEAPIICLSWEPGRLYTGV